MLLVGKVFWSAVVALVLCVLFTTYGEETNNSGIFFNVIIPLLGLLSVVIIIGTAITRIWLF